MIFAMGERYECMSATGSSDPDHNALRRFVGGGRFLVDGLGAALEGARSGQIIDDGAADTAVEFDGEGENAAT